MTHENDSGKDDKKWSERIRLRRLRVYINLSKHPEYIDRWRTHVARLATMANSTDEYDFLIGCLMDGVERAANGMQENVKSILNDPLHSEHLYWKRANAEMREIEMQEEESRRYEIMELAYRRRGREGFEEWCQDLQYDPKEYYRAKERKMDGMSWDKKVKSWLEQTLLNEIHPVPVAAIKRWATDAGLLDDGETKWNAFYQIAKRMNIHNKPSRGYFYLGNISGSFRDIADDPNVDNSDDELDDY